MVENWNSMIPARTSPPWYILVQDGKVLDVVDKPQGLMWDLVEDDQDFLVLVGIVNEFGVHEIVGPCAEYIHIESTIWCLTSPVDGYNRVVGKTGTAKDCIDNRLCLMYRNHRLDDPANFSKVTLRGLA